VCSTEVRLGLLLVATAASVACIDPSQPQISHKAAHIGAGANPNTRRNMPGTPTAHARHAYIDSARPQRTHAPSQAWTEASPICHKSAVSSRKERAAEKKKKKTARTVQAASVGACKEEAASPSQQLVQRQHQGVEAGKQAGGAGMRCVGGRISGGGEGGGGETPGRRM